MVGGLVAWHQLMVCGLVDWYLVGWHQLMVCGLVDWYQLMGGGLVDWYWLMVCVVWLAGIG